MNLREQLLEHKEIVEAVVSKSDEYKGQESWKVVVKTVHPDTGKMYWHSWEFVRKYVKPNEMLWIIKSYLKDWHKDAERLEQ